MGKLSVEVENDDSSFGFIYGYNGDYWYIKHPEEQGRVKQTSKDVIERLRDMAENEVDEDDTFIKAVNNLRGEGYIYDGPIRRINSSEPQYWKLKLFLFLFSVFFSLGVGLLSAISLSQSIYSSQGVDFTMVVLWSSVAIIILVILLLFHELGHLAVIYSDIPFDMTCRVASGFPPLYVHIDISDVVLLPKEYRVWESMAGITAHVLVLTPVYILFIFQYRPVIVELTLLLAGLGTLINVLTVDGRSILSEYQLSDKIQLGLSKKQGILVRLIFLSVFIIVLWILTQSFVLVVVASFLLLISYRSNFNRPVAVFKHRPYWMEGSDFEEFHQ